MQENITRGETVLNKLIADMTPEEIKREFFVECRKTGKLTIDKFKKNKRTCKERVRYVEDVREIMSMYKIKETPFDRENWGDYILKSNDIESHRKIDCSFHINEEEARKYAEYNKTDVTDMESREDLHMLSSYGRDYNRIDESYLNGLFKHGVLSYSEKRQLLRSYRSFYHEVNSETLQDQINFVIEDIYSNVRDDMDYSILEYLMSGVTEVEMEELLGVSQQAINKRIVRILTA